MTKGWRSACITVMVLLLLATAYNGIVEGLNATRVASTFGQRLATGTQLAYGAFAIAAIISIAFKHFATTALLLGWAVALVSTAALAPVVYAGASMTVALIAAFGAAVIGGFVIECWRRLQKVRGDSKPPAA